MLRFQSGLRAVQTLADQIVAESAEDYEEMLSKGYSPAEADALLLEALLEPNMVCRYGCPREAAEEALRAIRGQLGIAPASSSKIWWLVGGVAVLGAVVALSD